MMALSEYSYDTQALWAELMVDYGMDRFEAAACVGVLSDDVDEFTPLHIALLRDAKFNKWRNDMWGVIQLTTVLANINRNTESKSTPFEMYNFMPLTRQEREAQQKQELENAVAELEFMVKGTT